MQDWPDIPRQKIKKDTILLENPQYKESARAIYALAILAFQLGFESKQIYTIIYHSPDRIIVCNALLKAQPEDLFVYKDLKCCKSQFTAVFQTATELSPKTLIAMAEMDNPVRLPKQCGKPLMAE